nr:MAG TPA: hypothetical protein [Caudoviricetes sp.]
MVCMIARARAIVRSSGGNKPPEPQQGERQ